MRYSLFFLLPFALAAARSLAGTIQLPGKSEGRPTISADAECRALLIVIFCLSGLLVILTLMLRFPDLGAVIEEYNQI